MRHRVERRDHFHFLSDRLPQHRFIDFGAGNMRPFIDARRERKRGALAFPDMGGHALSEAVRLRNDGRDGFQRRHWPRRLDARVMRHAPWRADFSAGLKRNLDDCGASGGELTNELSRLFGRLNGFRDISPAKNRDRIPSLNRNDWAGREQTQFSNSARWWKQRPANVPHGGDAVSKNNVARRLTKEQMRMKFDKSRQDRRVAEVHLMIGLGPLALLSSRRQ